MREHRMEVAPGGIEVCKDCGRTFGPDEIQDVECPGDLHKVVAEGLTNYCAACGVTWKLYQQITCPSVNHPQLGGEESHAMDQTELLPHRDNPIDGVHGLGNIPDFLRKGAEPQYKSQISTILNTARDIHLQRNSAYGESYKRYGALLIALFPEGGVPPIRTAKEADRLSALMNCLGKLHRYAHNFEAGGHTDSAMDLINYAAMLVEATK